MVGTLVWKIVAIAFAKKATIYVLGRVSLCVQTCIMSKLIMGVVLLSVISEKQILCHDVNHVN